MIEDVKSELKRTGLTLRKLGLHISQTDRSKLPADILAQMLAGCSLRDITQHFDALIEVLRDIPTLSQTSIDQRTRRLNNNRIEITDDMRAKLDTELKRTQASISGACRTLFGLKHSESAVRAIRAARNGGLKTMQLEVWQKFTSHLAQLATPQPETKDRSGGFKVPEASAYPQRNRALSNQRQPIIRPNLIRSEIAPMPERPDMTYYNLSKRYVRAGYIIIDDRIFKNLHDERRRTCISPSLIMNTVDDVPSGLKINQISDWFRGKTKSAEKHYIDWLIETYKSLPDAHLKPKVKLDPPNITEVVEIANEAERKKVLAEYERTGVGAKALFRHLKSNVNDIRENDLVYALHQQERKCPAAHIKLILEAYATLPDNPFQPISCAMATRLKAEIKRTKLSKQKIYDLLGDEAPEHLTPTIIHNWSTGKAKTARVGYVELVLSLLKSLPDDAENTPSKHSQGLTRQMQNKLSDLRRRSKKTPKALLMARDDVPEGLDAQTINQWLLNEGKNFSIKHFEYVVSTYEDSLKSAT